MSGCFSLDWDYRQPPDDGTGGAATTGGTATSGGTGGIEASAGGAGGSSKCVLVSEPDVGIYTDPYEPFTNCGCGDGLPECRALYSAQVTALHPDGRHVDLRFKKENGETIPAERLFWIARVALQPKCTELDSYEVVLDGEVGQESLEFDVPNVPVWPDQASWESAPPGARRSLFLITDGKEEGLLQKLWFQKDPLVFIKTCAP